LISGCFTHPYNCSDSEGDEIIFKETSFNFSVHEFSVDDSTSQEYYESFIVDNDDNYADIIPFSPPPTPFGPITSWYFEVKHKGVVEFTVLDLSNTVIDTIKMDPALPGKYEIIADCSNVNVGIYVYAIKFNGNIVDKNKFLLIK